MSKRALLLVLDGMGIGEMPDARDFGDEGSNTLGNLCRAVGGLTLPALESLGLGNIGDFEGIKKTASPLASTGRMRELSKAKDTIAGHWEMMGIVSEMPFPTYPNGFPPGIIRELERRTGRKTLGNKPASGTQIIEELGPAHMKTGALIVYTSADSVFQIAAHEDIISPEELYGICMTAREILKPPHNVARVIARPFVGPPFKRTPRRRDFSIPPPGETVLDLLIKDGIDVVSVGKVVDMFSGRGFSSKVKTQGNADAMGKIDDLLLRVADPCLIFSTLVDFDTLYGHRNDPEGFASALREFDTWLGNLLPRLTGNDYLFLTADHGCDPTTPSTDHSREYVPVLFYNKALKPEDLGLRNGFLDIGATVAGLFGVRFGKGRSFFS